MNKKLLLVLAAQLIFLVIYVWYNESQRVQPQTASEQLKFLPQPTSNAKSLDIPTQLEFANEAVPVGIDHVRERFDRELHINTYWHNNTIFLIKRANRWLPQIESVLKEEGVPADFMYLPAIEGSFRNDVSPKNAVGFWQIIKSAGKENGLEITSEVDERYDPIKATRAACKYLKKSHKKFGNWTLVAASYNRGMAGLQRALDHQKVDSYYDLMLNDETSRYVFRIIAIKEIIENQRKYDFDVAIDHLYQVPNLRYIKVNETINDLVVWSQQNGANFKLLKEYNPWLRKDRLTVRGGKTYEIALPVTK